MLALAPLALALLATEAPSLDVTARTEARSDSPTPGATGAPYSKVLQLDASALATFFDGRWRFLVGYQPHFVTQNPDAGGNTAASLLHNARLSADYTASTREKFVLEQTFMVGQQNFSPLLASTAAAGTGTTTTTTTTPTTTTTTPALDPRLAGAYLVDVFQSQSSGSYSYSFDRRLTLRLHGYFQISGGATVAAQAVVPQQRGGGGDARVSWLASHHDQLYLEAASSTTAFSTATRTSLATFGAGYLTDFGARTTASVTAGFTESKGDVPFSPGTQTTDFTGSASISHTLPLDRESSLRGTLNGSMTSTSDPLSGTPYRLASSTASLTWDLRVVRLTATANAARALSGTPKGQDLVLADFAANFVPQKEFSVSLGARRAWQTAPDNQPTGVHGSQWAAYAAFVFAVSGHP
jgi:hypothetical protein